MILEISDFFEDKNLKKLISSKFDFYVNEFFKKISVSLIIDSFKSNSENLFKKTLNIFFLI